jgi:hypothetical protein
MGQIQLVSYPTESQFLEFENDIINKEFINWNNNCWASRCRCPCGNNYIVYYDSNSLFNDFFREKIGVKSSIDAERPVGYRIGDPYKHYYLISDDEEFYKYKLNFRIKKTSLIWLQFI